MQMFIALIALLFAIAIVTISLFLPPQGEVNESVIYVFAQLLIFVASLFGVDAIFTSKGNPIKPRSPTK